MVSTLTTASYFNNQQVTLASDWLTQCLLISDWLTQYILISHWLTQYLLISDWSVRQHSELCWILGTLCSMPNLARLTQYKDKAAKLKEIPLGLFIYPVLQSADVLLYKATEVPVGEDNLQVKTLLIG